MKRRRVIQSLLGIPAAAVLPAPSFGQEPKTEAQVANETPNTPTTDADDVANTLVTAFSPEQFAALGKLSEILMPSLPSTPGAREADAAAFLDFLISRSPADRVTLYREGLDRLNAEARKRYGKPFASLTKEQAGPILAPLRDPWTYRGSSDPFARFLHTAKDDVLTATFNSHAYIAVVSRRRRSAGGVGLYWYPIE